MTMRSLHVAAMPFPSPQGTQAAIASMLGTLSRHGHDVHLLSYSYGVGETSAHYVHHRSRGAPLVHSMRSGPSLGKLWMDGVLSRDVSRVCLQMQPDIVIAHHVEAALACQGLPSATAYVAHTSLELELSAYGPLHLRKIADLTGHALDRLALSLHGANAAIAPRLASTLRKRHARSVRYLPLPWPAHSSDSVSRERAREHYALPASARLVAYLGNLDRYQGVTFLLEAMSKVSARDPKAHLLVATASDSTELASSLSSYGLSGRVTFVTLGDERTRARVHAAANVVAVPRAAEGGVPVKLLDALSRGSHVVTVDRATSDLPVHAHCVVCPNDDVDAFASALLDAFESQAPPETGRAYMKREHSEQAFMAAFRALQEDAVTTAATRRAPQRSQAT